MNDVVAILKVFGDKFTILLSANPEFAVPLTPPSTAIVIRRSCSYSSDAAVASPSDFHSYLCDRIGRARDRMILASLYVGVGSGTYDDVPISTTATTAPNDDDDDDGPDDDASSFGGSVRRAQSRIIPSSATAVAATTASAE